MNPLIEGSPIIPVTGVDFSASLGLLVKNNAGAPAVNDSATAPAFGVVLEGNIATRQSSIGILGATGPVRMKAGGAIGRFSQVQQAADGTIVTDAGAGNARVIVGVALEAAAAGDLVLVQPWDPDVRS